MAEKIDLKPLPGFRKPPVVEVVLGVQFDELPGLSTAMIGLLWTKYRDEFPKVEDHPIIDPVLDSMGGQPGLRISLEPVNRPPRTWFINDRSDHVIQIQQDRFVVNWRRLEDNEPEDYPRFPHVLDLFSKSLDIFQKFLNEERIGSFVPGQCEVTYVNHIPLLADWRETGEVKKVLSCWGGSYSDGFLGEPEATRIQNRFIISDKANRPVGRLNADLRTVKIKNEQDAIVLNLTANGQPLSSDLSGVFGFLELGREWVVRGFASLTTENMHSLWERYE